MSRLVTEIVVCRDLDPNAKQRFADELYEAHCHIFDGVDKQGFVGHVIESKAQDTSVQVYRNEEGQIVGYFAVHVVEKNLNGKVVAIFRAQAGMMRRYRGGGVAISFGIDRIARYMAAHPGRSIYYLGFLVHPSSYLQLARFADRVWPNPEHSVPANLAGLMSELSRECGFECVDDGTPLVRKVGWVTKDGVCDTNYWKSHENPYVRFFLQENSGYGEGHGLLTLVPLTACGVARAAGRFAAHKAKRRAQAAMASIRREFFGSAPIAT